MNSQPRILAIETSGRTGSAAIAQGDTIVAQGRLEGDMQHARELLPLIERLLHQAGWSAPSLSEVYVSIGPGSFTGLRIGVTIARTLAWSIGARIVGVPTLDCLVCNALSLSPPPAHVAVILDAKRSQVYAGVFDHTGESDRAGGGSYSTRIAARLAEPLPFLTSCPQPLAVLGEGIDYHQEAVRRSGACVLDRTCWPGRAENVLRVGLQMAAIGQYTQAGDLLPLYIRRPEAEEKWDKLHPISPR